MVIPIVTVVVKTVAAATVVVVVVVVVVVLVVILLVVILVILVVTCSRSNNSNSNSSFSSSGGKGMVVTPILLDKYLLLYSFRFYPLSSFCANISSDMTVTVVPSLLSPSFQLMTCYSNLLTTFLVMT